MDRELIDQAVSNKARDKKINCAEALALADELDVSPKLIGDACNRLEIKIKGCQLGCF